jgi:hypothetical protein
MKSLFMFVIFCNLAWPQTETGTVVVFVLSENEITVAAESRAVQSDTGKPDDTSCKIRAFGDQFFFSMAGPSGHKQDAAGPGWSAYRDARSAWRKAGKLGMVSSAQGLTNDVAERWAVFMEGRLNERKVIKEIRHTLWGNTVASGLFGGTNRAGEIAVTRTDIFVDLPLFDRKGIVKLWHDKVERQKLRDGGALGLGEIAAEYVQRTTETTRQNRNLSPGEQDAEIARKLVELSITMHPRREMLGGKIDELRLDRGKGITWLKLKQNCKKQE